jgi:hypothetical protein
MSQELDVTPSIEQPSLPELPEADLSPVEEAQLASERARLVFEARQDAGPWMDDYFDLLDEGWSWRQAVYMLWASQPKDLRRPQTQWELATEVLGLTSDRQIRNWKAKNPGIEKRIGELAAGALLKARPDIYQALIESASQATYRNHQDRKLALEMLGDYVPRQRMDVAPIVDAQDFEDADSETLASMARLPIQGTESDESADEKEGVES